MAAAPDGLKRRLGEGILAFPATCFAADGALDPGAFEEHVSYLAERRPAALVPAGGAGELFSLGVAEHESILRASVARAARVPVIPGVGNGLAIALAMARAAERAGADAILLFPPYLVAAEQEGLYEYARRICRAVGIGVIVYSRDNGVMAPDTALRLADACPNFIGLKDGTGDFDALQTLRVAAGDRLVLINGTPTAEMIAAQCFAIGIRSYSSAVFSFLPDLAQRFFQAVRDEDGATAELLMREFYLPLIAIRRRRRGYAVSIMKAGLRAVGRPAGPVRPPLVELTPEEQAEIEALVAGADALLAEPGPARPARVGAKG